MHLAGAVLDRVPIDQAAVAGVADDDAEALVVGENVFEQVATDELIEQLSQSQLEILREIFVDDCVRLLDHRERGGARLEGDEDFASHHTLLLLFC